ncbi:MAG TPA: YdcF family protein [Blastocatellia bacterium]|nr:YdcF family protein [Blastocatellia bacterium]
MSGALQVLNHFRRSKRARWLFIVFACLPGVYFLTPVLLNEAAEGLIRKDGLVKADVIVALAGDYRCNREKRAAELYHEGWADNVVVSGMSYAWGLHTGEAARRYVMSLGVPEEKISMISETLNTRAEARALDELMRERGWNSAIIVTSAFHSRRAMYTVERAAPGRTFYSSPVPTGSPEWTPRAWWSRREDVYVTVREFTSWANTLVGGWQ